MRRAITKFVIVLALVLLVAPLAPDAQQPARVARIGYLEFGSAAPGMPYVEALRQGLRDLGWIEGQNIAIEVRYARGKLDQLPELAAELVRLKVDLIFASTTPAALAVKHATATIPIVIGFVGNPVLAARSRLRAMYGSSDLVEAGGLMAYGVNLPELYQRGASYIDRILKGAKPDDLPVERPTRFYLVINLKTAKTLGLTIPQSLLLRADQVIDR